ncbi:hypothetical protein NLJ89_g5331 [Agrocybe chaxingu]|uniref:Uncharacterized protein n=1 Tax=Agrocybe chaxingu TaxID=84603 RepID=A0A9W8K8F5_9AGAR|nr:hypothetical protein NLJ89_g5331 [Agrocybe chaxingu]
MLNSRADEVSALGYVVWAENSRGKRHKIERIERDESSGNKLKVYLRQYTSTRHDTMRFQLSWRSTEHQTHHCLCTTTVSPLQHDQGKRHCFIPKNSNDLSITGRSGCLTDLFQAALPPAASPGSYVATATLKIKRVKAKLTTEAAAKIGNVKRYFPSLPDFGEENILVEEPPKIFEFEFHHGELAIGGTPQAVPARIAKRKQIELEDSDSDDNNRPSPDNSTPILVQAPNNYKRPRVSDSYSQPSASGSSSQGTIHLERRLTPPSIPSAPSNLDKNIQKLKGIMEERQMLERELEKRVKEEEAKNEIVRQALAKYST